MSAVSNSKNNKGAAAIVETQPQQWKKARVRPLPAMKISTFQKLKLQPSDHIYTNMFGQYIVPNNHGCPPPCPGGEEAVLAALREGQVFEGDSVIPFVRQNLNKGGLVTAGTYIGDSLPAFASNASFILGFEPVASYYKYAVANVKLNGISNVVLLDNSALSSKTTEEVFMDVWETINTSWTLGGRAMIVAEGKVNEKSSVVSVKAISLDDAIKKHSSRIPEDVKFSVLHLDVEGHELEALQGAVTFLRTHRPIVVLERLNNSWPVAEPFSAKSNNVRHCNTSDVVATFLSDKLGLGYSCVPAPLGQENVLFTRNAFGNSAVKQCMPCHDLFYVFF